MDTSPDAPPDRPPDRPPDPPTRPPLDAARLSVLHPAVVSGLRVEVVQETHSTNAVLVERARAGAREGLVIVTEHQTAGRGRLDRTWVTPARSALTFSVLLRPSVFPRRWPWLPLLAGYEVDGALRGAGYDSRVKWPNDVLIADRKVAGILSEIVDTGATGPAAVVGIGVNVAMTQDELPVASATSLLMAGGPDRLPDRTDLLLVLLQTFWEGYQVWQAGGEAAAGRLRTSYAAACTTVGHQVRVDRPAGEAVVGRATGVDSDGRLLVATSAGDVAVSAGDVIHVRPA